MEEKAPRGMITVEKRIASLLLAVVLFFTLARTASAGESGSVAGNYHYTDIVAYLWGVPVNSVNIGGRTLIDAESMTHYGFEVIWHPEERWLEIIDNGGQVTDDVANSGVLLDMAPGKPGEIAGEYYYTDIVTTLNGKEIESYNVGGRTFIAAENMIDYGYAVDWLGDTRRLYIGSPSNTEVAVCEPWNVIVYPGLDTAHEGKVDYCYVIAERNWASLGVFDTFGSGYQALSGINLARSRPGQISLSFSVYQYIGLDAIASLLSKLGEVVSFKYGEYIRDPESVYDELNGLMQVYLNGERVMISELQYFTGNGHADYTLVLDADITLEKSDVFSIAMLCNVPEDEKIRLPSLTVGLSAYEYVVQRIRGATSYTSLWEHETDTCMILCGVQTGTPHGASHWLHLVYRTDGRTVNLLSKTGLATIWGIHPAPYDLSVSDDETALYFSCDSAGVTYHFSADLITGDVSRVD